MKLTKTDRMIMDSYASMIEGLSEYLGSAYEISLHSLEDYNHSVVKIMNGYHSGRVVGAPLTDLAINMLKRINDEGVSSTSSYTSYNTVTNTGDHLKSSTIPILGDGGRVIGMLCINFYLDSPLSEIVQSITGNPRSRTESEYFASSMPEALSEAIGNARKLVMQNPSIPSTNKNKELIRILYEKGIFKVKDAVASVAEALDISKNTVYLHLRSFQKETEG